jgi:hypothetical protein
MYCTAGHRYDLEIGPILDEATVVGNSVRDEEILNAES